MQGWIDRNKSDEALIKAYAGGRVAAFEYLYLRYRKRLFSFLRRQCHCDAISEELAHDAWLAVIRRAGEFDPRAHFRTWLFRIAHNRLVDYWRKHGSSRELLTQEIFDLAADDPDPTPGQIEIREIIQSLEILSAEQLETMLLKIEGFSYAEIAEITDTGTETVKSRLRYATRHMKLALEVSL